MRTTRAERRRLGEEYVRLRRTVATILYNHDPIGLASAGAPPDEYAPEAGTILARARRARTVEELRRIVHREFVSWFDPQLAGSEERYDRVALDVWEALGNRCDDQPSGAGGTDAT